MPPAASLKLEPLPFGEAIGFFRDKVPMTAGAYRALTDIQREKAFTVARVASADILMDIRDALDRAIADGETPADFESRLAEIMAARGWQGLTPWHTETVFRNNIQTAYSVGRFRQMQALGDRFYGEYDAVNDSATRPTHSALAGRIFPLDHPFWDTWWPPNGHRCRCSVNPVHKHAVEEEGLKVETEDPTGGLVEPIDPKTGRVMPARPLMPDPGWDHHPARSEWEPDLEKYPKRLSRALEADGLGKSPLGVRNFDDVRALVAEKLTPLTRLPEGSALELIRRQDFNSFMATDSKGKIAVSAVTFPMVGNFAPADDLVAAFRNLGRRELSFNQEYALESLWHEIMHNRQQHTPRFGIPKHAMLTMETVNQWLSRRTYGRMLDALGGFAPGQQKEIAAKGYGYASFVKRFDRLLQKLGVRERDIVEPLYRIHGEVDRYEYAVPVAALLAETAGKPDMATRIELMLQSLLSEEEFERLLGEI